jgi:uncharacterized membrane protein YcaP (DUF421 family)
MFWSNGSDLLRIIIIGPLVYLALILILRVTGKRMLSKMNAFDFVVTIALGSVLATVLMSKDIALAEGILGLAVLIGLQYVIAWSSTRSRSVNRIIKSEPTLLYYRGEFLRDALRQENVAEDALRAGMRSSGVGSMDDVEAVVLESDGSVSIIKPGSASRHLLLDPRNRPEEASGT